MPTRFMKWGLRQPNTCRRPHSESDARIETLSHQKNAAFPPCLPRITERGKLLHCQRRERWTSRFPLSNHLQITCFPCSLYVLLNKVGAYQQGGGEKIIVGVLEKVLEGYCFNGDFLCLSCYYYFFNTVFCRKMNKELHYFRFVGY